MTPALSRHHWFGLTGATLAAVALSATTLTAPAHATPPNIPSKSTAQSELNAHRELRAPGWFGGCWRLLRKREVGGAACRPSRRGFPSGEAIDRAAGPVAGRAG
ncbi:hypothetical protein [Streptomyces sirii]|uniref:hypothetical protein n=1 Tax=Streptomyces sirii TaxID=3127701 RepID=UPI003D35C4AD